MALHDGNLGELNLSARVVPLLHHLGHGAKLRVIAPLPSGVERQRRREIVKPVAIERLDRADRLVAPIALGRRGHWRAQRETGLPKALGGELAVIGDRHAGGARVETLGRIGIAHGLGGSPLPIGGSGDGQGILGGLGRKREALSGRRSVIKEAQGDPAGVEGRVDLSLGRIGPDSLVADFERKLRLVEIEQRAGDHLALAPPSLRIDDRGAIVRREAQHDRRLVDAPHATRVLDPGEQETGIVAQRRRNRLDQPRAHWRASRRDAGLGER